MFVLLVTGFEVDMSQHKIYGSRPEWRMPVFLICRFICIAMYSWWQYQARADFRRGANPNTLSKYGWIVNQPFKTQRLLMLTNCLVIVLIFISYDALSKPHELGDLPPKLFLQEELSKEDIVTEMQRHERSTGVNSLMFFFVFYCCSTELQLRFHYHFAYGITIIVLMLITMDGFWYNPVTRFSDFGMFWAAEGKFCFVILWLINLKNLYHTEVDTRQRFKAYISLERTRSRADGILRKLVPPDVYEEIKEMPGSHFSPPSHKYRRACIAQSDLVGFTKLSSTKTPIEVVTFMSDLFGRFDDHSDKRGVWKVETIGDAYIAGMADKPLTDEMSAVSVVLFGQDMVKAVEAWKKDFGFDDSVKVRVGIHFGPCIGGIVGLESQRYHLFGDLMSVLTTMEATSISGRVHVSKTCKEEVERQVLEEGPVDGELEILDFERRQEEVLTTSKNEVHYYREVGGQTYLVAFREQRPAPPSFIS
jgi:class 3 adenylate cyclase